MNSQRLHLALIAVISLMFIAMVGGAYGTTKLLASQSSKLVGLRAKSAALGKQQQSLTKAKKDIVTYSDLNKIAEAVVPQDKDQAEAVREIVNIASSNGVVLGSISFPASTLGSTGTGAAASGASASAAPTVAPSAAATTQAANLSQLLPVKSIAGVYQLQITIASDAAHPVSYSKIISFLSGLEHNRRTAQISTLSLQPDPLNRSLLTFTFGLNEYIKP